MNKLFILLVLILVSCKGDTTTIAGSKPKAYTIESIQQRGETLTVKTAEKEYQVNAHDSMMIYDLSPDSTSLLVNARVLSNIQISQVYQLGDDGTMNDLSPKNLSTVVWDSICKLHNIHSDEILNPKTLAKYTGPNRIKVIASGQTEMGLMIEEEIEVMLKRDSIRKDR